MMISLKVIFLDNLVILSLTLSAFAGLGKTTAFRKMARNVEFVKVIWKLSEEWHLEEEMLKVLGLQSL